MIRTNRQRCTPYVMPIRRDVTRQYMKTASPRYVMPIRRDVTKQYMKTASPRNFYGWTIRNGHKH